MTLQSLVKKFAELGENIQINNACLCYSMSRILGLQWNYNISNPQVISNASIRVSKSMNNR